MEARSMAGHLIRRLHQHATQIFSKKVKDAGFDLTSVQFAAMDAINTYPDSDQAQIAAFIAYDRATIGGVIDRLEQKGLVLRQVSPHDRRARQVRLTPRGQETYTSLLPIVESVQRDILQELSEEDQATLMRLARAILALDDT